MSRFQIEDVVVLHESAPTEQPTKTPFGVIGEMYRDFLGPSRQSGTIRTLVQGLCAVEMAMWDLRARRADLPLCHLLFDRPHDGVGVYASGINSLIPWDLIDEHLNLGVKLFNLKLGFDDDKDRSNVEQLSDHLALRERFVAQDVAGQSRQGLPV